MDRPPNLAEEATKSVNPGDQGLHKKMLLFYILLYNNQIFLNEIKYENIISYLLIIYIN